MRFFQNPISFLRQIRNAVFSTSTSIRRRKIFRLAALAFIGACAATPDDLYRDAGEKFAANDWQAGLDLARQAYSARWAELGTRVLDAQGRQLVASAGRNVFAWKNAGTVTLYEPLAGTRQTIQVISDARSFALSPEGNSVLFFSEAAGNDDGCLMVVYMTDQKTLGKRIFLKNCEFPGTVLDGPGNFAEFDPQKGILKKTPDDTAPKRLTIGLLLPLKTGIFLVHPQTSERKLFLDFKKLPSAYPLVPPQTYVWQVPHRNEVLVARGNAGAYALYHYDYQTGKLTRYSINMKLPEIRFSSRLDEIFFVRGGAGEEKLTRFGLYGRKTGDRPLIGNRRDIREDTAGNLFSVVGSEVIKMPVVGTEYSLPAQIRALEPMADNVYLAELERGGIVQTALLFDARLAAWHRAILQADIQARAGENR